MEPTKGVKLRESASRDVAGDLWLVILEEALEHQIVPPPSAAAAAAEPNLSMF